MSEHTEGRRLPETWEEYDRAVKLRERAAFEKGAIYWAGGYIGDPATEATFRYQITRKVPRSIVLESGAVARATAEGVEIDGFGTRTTNSILLRYGSVQALMELMKNPFDEVAE